MSYKLYNGDCLEIMNKLIEEGVKVDAIITDPPYGVTPYKWDSVIPLDKMWDRVNELIKDNGAIVLFGREPFTSELRISNKRNYKYEWYWNKNCSANFLTAKFAPLRIIENICIFSNGKCPYNPQMMERTEKEMREYIAKIHKDGTVKDSYMYTGFKDGALFPSSNPKYKYPVNLLNFSAKAKECNSKHRLHPTQKPLDLLEYLVKTYTNAGDLVLDFTMGSGSTGVACLNTNRNFIGIELDEKYFNIAKNRLKSNKLDDVDDEKVITETSISKKQRKLF